MIEGSGEFQNKDFDDLENKILFHSINFASIHFNNFDCPQEVSPEAMETNSNHRKIMLLNFDLAQIAEDYVPECCDPSRTVSENGKLERTQTKLFRNRKITRK